MDSKSLREVFVVQTRLLVTRYLFPLERTLLSSILTYQSGLIYRLRDLVRDGLFSTPQSL